MLKRALEHLTSSFDKTKAMRNAERHVAQGKIRAAISEYKSVIQNDPRDFATMNMLGDLYVKNSETKKGVECYKAVAEHYQKQGFSQKAIAVYKKISKLDPNSLEISAKLAELYQTKGSLSEARSHYTTLAEHYRSTGKIIEALAIWKQIALLDPNDTEVYLNLADSYLQEEQMEEATDAYAEAALRLSRAGRNEEAAENFQKALAITPNDPKALEGLVKAYYQLGTPQEAATILEAAVEKEPYNQDVMCLLIDTYLGSGDPVKAEQTLIRLAELESSHSPRFLDLAAIYLGDGDITSAVRVLTLCIEKLLPSGRAADCKRWIDAILEKEPANLGALRLKVRYSSWERQKKELRSTLEALAEAAQGANAVDDERYALSQLVIIVPQEQKFAERLREINDKFGFDENPYDDAVLSAEYSDQDPNAYFEGSDHPTVDASTQVADAEMVIERNGFEISGGDPLDAELIEDAAESEGDDSLAAASFARDNAIEKELESIRFYVENGYAGLARTALTELRAAHGDRPEFDEAEALIQNVPAEEDLVVSAEIEAEPVQQNGNGHTSKSFSLDEMRSELGLDEQELDDGSDDYDTHYQLAVAYHEMGLMEEAIKEFQDAINLVKPDDSKQRFFQCANLLGHCFMQNRMAKLALKWYNRALETPSLGAEEKKAMWYEIALAYEADGDAENAGRYFEQVYSEDVDFRDIAERMKNVLIAA